MSSQSPTTDDLVVRLRAAGCVFAEDEAALLNAAASGPDLEALVTRRLSGEPLETVLGWVEFDGLRLQVSPGVFVPRQRTTHLARQAAQLLSSGRLLVDLCCGVGAIAAAASAGRDDLEVWAVDSDPAALRDAHANLPNATVLLGDLFAPLPHDLAGRVDVLTVNAPYVPTDAIVSMPPEARDHEPRVALDGGTDGLDVHRRVLAEVGTWLRPGGRLLIEVAEAQVATAEELFVEAGLLPTLSTDDELGAQVLLGRAGSALSQI